MPGTAEVHRYRTDSALWVRLTGGSLVRKFMSRMGQIFPSADGAYPVSLNWLEKGGKKCQKRSFPARDIDARRRSRPPRGPNHPGYRRLWANDRGLRQAVPKFRPRDN
jgi:hypothetical protein